MFFFFLIDSDAAVKLIDAGRLVEAENCFNQILEKFADPPAAVYANLGVIQLRSGKYNSALRVLEHSVHLAPNDAVMHFNLGNGYKETMQLSKAAQCYKKTIELEPTHAGAWLNLAIVYETQDKLMASNDAYMHALQLKPGWLIATVQLALVSLRACNWPVLNSLREAIDMALIQTLESLQTGQHPMLYPFDALRLGLSPVQASKIASAHAAQAIRLAEQALPTSPFQSNTIATPEMMQFRKKLRVGYVCGNVGDHPLARDMLHVWLHHSRQYQHITLYALNSDDGTSWYSGQRNAVDEFVSLSKMNAVDVFQSVHADVLIDLNGYTMHAHPSLFAMRPAPVQVLFKGFAGTSGAPFIGHVITDKVTTPCDIARTQITERAVILPGTSFANSHRYLFPTAPLARVSQKDRDAISVAPNEFLFCCFNNLYKVCLQDGQYFYIVFCGKYNVWLHLIA